MRAIDADALREKYADQLSVQRVFGYDAGFVDGIRAALEMPIITPPNEWVSRVRELDELCTKIRVVTGFTAEQLLEMFAAGYTLEKPDYSKHFEAMENLADATPPNELMEALEAINNSAVAYIEGGPYENDLPGMELAVEIDRLSRDFVRQPNEPLTLEQLRASPHGKIKDSTLQSICNRANEIACRPPERQEDT